MHDADCPDDLEDLLSENPELACLPVTTSEPPIKTRAWVAWACIVMATLFGSLALVVYTGDNAPVDKPPRSSDLQQVSVAKWLPVPRTGELHGLVPLPGQFPGINAWQIDSIAPGGSVRQVRWSPNGKMIAVTSHDGRLRVYRYENEMLALHRIAGTATMDLVECVWTHDSALIVVNDERSALRIFDVKNSQFVKHFDAGSNSTITSQDAHPNREIVALVVDGIPHLWPLDQAQPTAFNDLSAHLATWNPLGDSLVLVDTANEQLRTHTLRDDVIVSEPTQTADFRRPYQPLSIAFDGTGARFLVMGNRQGERFDAETLQSVDRTPTFSSGGVRLDPKPESEISVVGQNARIGLIDGAKTLNERRVPGMLGFSPPVDWRPDGKLIAFGGIGSVFVTDSELADVCSIGGTTNLVGVQVAEGTQTLCVGAGRNEIGHFEIGGHLIAADQREIIDSRMMLRFEINQATLGGVVWSAGDQIGRQLFTIPNRQPRESLDLAVDQGQLWIEYDGAARSLSRVTIRRRGSTTFETIVENNEGKFGMTISPDETRFAMMGFQGATQIRSTADGKVQSEYRATLTGRPRSAIWPDEQTMIVSTSAAGDWTITSIHPDTGVPHWTIHDPQAADAGHDSVHTLIQRDDKSFVSTTLDGLAVCDIHSGEMLQQQETKRKFGIVPSFLGRNHHGDIVFSWNSRPDRGQFVVWDLRSIQPRWHGLLLGQHEWVTMSAAGQIICGTDGATSQLVWIVKKQQEETETLMTYQSFLDLVDETSSNHPGSRL